MVQWVKNLTTLTGSDLCRGTGLTPGLAQWVKGSGIDTAVV